MVLSSMTVIMTIIVPIGVWADDGNQWGELKAWTEIPDNEIPVLIIKDVKINEKQVDIVKNAIYSEKTNSKRTLFFGWNEGIKEISKSTKSKIPTLKVQDKLDGSQAIIIHLTDKMGHEKHNGYTNPSYDHNGQIQRMYVTIYNVDELNTLQLESIIRHELGHAMGLSHTNLKNDLMQPIINMNFNTISYHDLQGLAHIY